jgi:CheY-like chemotaxis protein
VAPFSASRDAAGEARWRSRRSVLVVDDDSACATALEEQLLQTRCAVVVVSSAEEALARLETDWFDVAIVDLGLPGLSGQALIQRMAADARTVGLPVVIVSAQNAVLPGGAVAYLRKPVNSPQLLDIVSRQLE